MEELLEKDQQLIDMAKEIIKKNYDMKNFKHTVGSAVRCKSGKVYLGVNVYSLHGACAEMIAIGNAITSGERDFDCIIAIGGENSDIIYSPCGNCRQILSDYCPDCDVIVSTQDGMKKIKAKDLLPLAYITPTD